MLWKSLTGDDVFISYSRRDGALYAAGIADKLTERKLSCFIDKLGVEPDHELPPSLIRKIQSCQVFVVIGTERASESRFVADEIKAFKKNKRTILPIDFNGAVGRARWYELIPGLPVEAERDPAALETGNPSTNVVNFIEKSFKYTRRNQRMFRMFWGALSVFLALTVLNVFFWVKAQSQKSQLDKQGEELVEQGRKIKAAEGQAQEAAKKAAEETTWAELMQQKAGEATEEAIKKTGEAEKATQLADARALLAQKAEGQARAAEGRRRVAEARAIKQGQIASSLESAADSLSLLPVDPKESLRRADEALSHVHTELAENAFRSAFFASHVQAVIRGSFNDFGANAFDSTGHALLGDKAGSVNVIDTGTGNVVEKLTTAHGTDLIHATFSPKGDYVAAADDTTGEVYLWKRNDAASLEPPRVLSQTLPDDVAPVMCRQGKCGINSIVFSPDGKYVAAAGYMRAVWVWDTATGDQEQVMADEHTKAINQIRFSPDGRYIVSAGRDGKAILWFWNPQWGETKLITLAHEGREVGLAAFSPEVEGKHYVVTTSAKLKLAGGQGEGPGEAWVWDTAAPSKEPIRLIGHTDLITGVEFSPDGKRILTASSDGTARIWDWNNETTREQPTILTGYAGGLNGARFSPGDGKYVLTYGEDDTARLWKPAPPRDMDVSGSGPSVDTPSLAVLRGHTADINSARFSPDGKLILTVGQDQTARIWRMEGEQIVASVPEQQAFIEGAAFSPADASLLATTTPLPAEPVRVWSWQAQGGDMTLREKLRAPRNPAFTHVSFSPDGKLIAAATVKKNPGSGESDVAVWNWTEKPSDPDLYGGCRYLIRSVAFSHNDGGRYIIAAGQGAGSAPPGGPGTPGSSVVCIWDRQDAASSNDPCIPARQEAVAAGRRLNNPCILEHEDRLDIRGASFSNDDRYVVAAFGPESSQSNGLVLVWDWRSKEKPSQLAVPESLTSYSFFDAVFDPSGQYIAAAGGGSKVALLWKWPPGKQRTDPVILRGHLDSVKSVAFSPDSKLLLTSSSDGTQRLWSVSTGDSLATISGRVGSSSAASFSRDGRFILTMDGKTAHVHACEKCAPLDDLRRLARDYLLPESTKTTPGGHH